MLEMCDRMDFESSNGPGHLWNSSVSCLHCLRRYQLFRRFGCDPRERRRKTERDLIGRNEIRRDSCIYSTRGHLDASSMIISKNS